MASSPNPRNHRNHRTSASSSSRVASPLSGFPKFSPPSSRNTSPVRRPLHDRSNSQTNQYSGPTIRIVEDPGIDATDIYSKTPFPSQSSQILPPRKAPGYTFESRGARVSDLSPVANAVAKIEAGQSLVPVPLHLRKAIRHSTSTSTSDADTIVASSFSPSSTRFSQGSTPPSSPRPDSWNKERELEILEEDISLSPSQRVSTIRTVPPSSSGADPSEPHALTPRASAASLASTASTDTLTHRDHQRGSSSISRPISKVPNYALSVSSDSDKKKQASSTNTEPQRPTSKVSRESIAYSDISYSSERPRSSSQPSPTIHEAQHATLESGVRVNFPIVRAPSASSLWAESQNLPTISSRMNNRASQVHHWSSQLSTIPSESDRASRSIERRSQSFDGRPYSHDDYAGNGRGYTARRRQTIESIASSDNVSSNPPPTGSSIVVPLPLFSPITRPSQEERESDEHHDTISPLQSPPIRKQRSGFLRRHDSDSRSSSSRPGSSQSDLTTFISSTIPAWARVYYRRGERASIGAPESMSDGSEFRLGTAQSGRTNTPSEGNFPLSIYRPRNRPHERMSHPETMSISDDMPIEQEIYVIGPPRRPRTELFTPRLRQDRRSQARLSAWKAPSFDDTLGTMLFSRQNRQILLFVFGFIFPISWMIAAFLPLPLDPEMVEESSPSQMDLERQFAQEVGPVDDRSYQKALWWRNLNRIMAAIGTLLIGVIVSVL
ncbi:hypothetical protein K505DRAFT_244216 [Melanomma pulvis-pyrius CBS 109.77]|uniref:Serine-rich protein n=1 Tax=Melanomma pulvis-pyrius CBS 109.77 TaxID=1314802 RepID=A0A6A6XB97_9PLEO|nr:hypothetical protein K505DRAFT_244216 [Melanomma pulvis-pyrius CBS 109.77]